MSRIPVTVYTLPVCVQCDMTKRQLTKFGIEFTEVPLTDELANEFKAKGFMAAPIVTTDIKTWSGFKFAHIKSLSAHIFGDKNVS